MWTFSKHLVTQSTSVKKVSQSASDAFRKNQVLEVRLVAKRRKFGATINRYSNYSAKLVPGLFDVADLIPVRPKVTA